MYIVTRRNPYLAYPIEEYAGMYDTEEAAVNRYLSAKTGGYTDIKIYRLVEQEIVQAPRLKDKAT